MKSRLLSKSISSVVGVNRKLWQGQVWATLFLNRCGSLGGIRITEHAERQAHNVTSLLLHTGNLKLRDQVTYLMSFSKWQIQDSNILSFTAGQSEGGCNQGGLPAGVISLPTEHGSEVRLDRVRVVSHEALHLSDPLPGLES